MPSQHHRVDVFDRNLEFVGKGCPEPRRIKDTSHAEKGSPAVQAASELANRALVEGREFAAPGSWCLPLLEQGEVVAVLVAQSAAPLPESALLILRTSAVVTEPLLRHWREAQRGLLPHAGAALRGLGL